jgi:hypothetical protein
MNSEMYLCNKGSDTVELEFLEHLKTIIFVVSCTELHIILFLIYLYINPKTGLHFNEFSLRSPSHLESASLTLIGFRLGRIQCAFALRRFTEN